MENDSVLEPDRSLAQDERAKDKATRKWQRALYSGHVGASSAATVFKALSLIILVVGTVCAIGCDRWLHEGATTLGKGQVSGIVIGIVVSTLVIASMCAFFGYVLTLLIDIENNTRETAFNVLRGDIPPPRTRRAAVPTWVQRNTESTTSV